MAVTVGCAAAVAASFAGGASAASTASTVAAAKAALKAASAVPVWTKPGPAFNAAKAKGKTIALLPDYSSLPFTLEINQGIMPAAKAAGLKVQNCANNGTVGGWVTCFDQYLAETPKPSMIVLNGSPSPSELQPQIKKANAEGIPVIANHVPLNSEFPKGSLPATNETGLAGAEAGPFIPAAKLMADYAFEHTSGAKVDALIITAEAPASNGLVDTIQSQLKALCGSSCKTTVINVPIDDWATKLQGAVQTALLANPSINWAIPIYDGAYPYVVPGIQSANRSKTVKTVSYNGQGAALTYISKGQVTATIGENLAWTGWATVDVALRILATGKDNAYPQATTPNRVWDSTDIKQAGTPVDPTKGYGTTYQADYLKLWGLK